MKYFILLSALLFSLNLHALANLELEIGTSALDRKGSTQDAKGSVFRMGASVSLLPMIDMDFKYGFTTGESDNKVANLAAEMKPQEEQDTHFLAFGVSIKLINLFRVGGGPVYQKSKFVSNTTVTNSITTKHNDLGYYLDLGLYKKWTVVGASLTFTHQSAGNVDSQFITAGIVVGI